MIWKKKEPTDFETEEQRLLAKRRECEPGSDEYDRVNGQLEKLYALYGKRKDLKRKVPTEIKSKAVSFGCMAGLTGLIYYLEQRKGIALTGGFKQEGNGLFSGAAKIFTKFL